MYLQLKTQLFMLATQVFKYVDSTGAHEVEITSGHPEWFIFLLYPTYFMMDTMEPIVNNLVYISGISEDFYPLISLFGFIIGLQVLAINLALWFWVIYTIYVVFFIRKLDEYIVSILEVVFLTGKEIWLRCTE
ncbi:MAG: hypothetical protein ACQES9_13650 [Myxococcota bacterium]